MWTLNLSYDDLNGPYKDRKSSLTGQVYSDTPMIDAEFASFLEAGLAIHLGTRNGQLEPNGARVTAVRVEADGVHLIAYVPKVAAARILPDLRSNQQAALAFARPTDDRACQVKGVFVSARAARANEQPFVSSQWAAFLEHLARIGIPRETTAGWVTWPAVAIRIRATALFEQTPGPAAGAALA